MDAIARSDDKEEPRCKHCGGRALVRRTEVPVSGSSLLPLILLGSSAGASEPMVYRSSCFESPMFLEAGAPPPAGAAAPVAPAASRAPSLQKYGSMGGLGSSRKARRGSTVLDEAPTPAPTPATSWGGSTWLSNDDSMSLASAQRVLWAAAEGRAIPTSQIRPHELLNYFNFDTVLPEGRSTFEVTASAMLEEDTLSVAFAVQGAHPPRRPLDLTLVVDRSGSMDDEGRMVYVKRGLHLMRDQLQDGDRLDLVLFDHRSCTVLENFVVGRDDPALLREVVDRIQPEGGTNLDAGLREAYAVAARKEGKGRNRRVMLLTDALLNVGEIDPDVVSEIGRRFEEEEIRLTGIGVGRSFNDAVLDRLTEKGKGAYVYLGSEAVVDRIFGEGFDSLVETIAHDVRFRLDLPDSLAMERFYGEEASAVREDVQPIHYHAGNSQVFLQDLKVRPGRSPLADPIALEVSWEDPHTGSAQRRRFSLRVEQMLEADPYNVHKAQTLMAFADVLLARSMGTDCEKALARFEAAAAKVEGDPEIDYVAGLAAKSCGAPERAEEAPPLPRGARLVDLKVRVDSDVPIRSVVAICPSGKTEQELAGSTVVRFRTSPGRCKLVLHGRLPMTEVVEVPEVGGSVRCVIRAGQVDCG